MAAPLCLWHGRTARAAVESNPGPNKFTDELLDTDYYYYYLEYSNNNF